MKRKDTGDSVAPKIKRMFGKNLRTLRERTGKSQELFAKENGFDRTFVSQLERGLSIPSLETVARAAYGLDVTIAELTVGMDGIVPEAKAAGEGSTGSRQRKRRGAAT